VDHHCHRCGAAVADNAPFCSQCGAPQIRVNVNAPDGESGAATVAAPPVVPSRVNWRIALPRVLGAAVLGTILLVVFSRLLPQLLMMALIVPFTGAISVWFYKSRDPRVDGGMGFRLGAVTGFFLFMLNLLPVALAYLLTRQEFLTVLKQQFEQSAQRSDPRTQDLLNNMIQHPETIAAVVAIVAVVMLMIFSVSAGIGGAIAGRGARHG
jgi:zinc ribbon protein